jgi:hypothetical protein
MNVNIKPYTADSKALYLLDSDANQYAATKSGGLYRLGVSGGAVTAEKAASLNPGDTAVITTANGKDDVYILSSDGLINGKATGVIKIKTGKDSFVNISLKDKFFVVQE